LRFIKCELNSTLIGEIEVDEYISERINKSNALSFCEEVWCQSHLCDYAMPNMAIQPNEVPIYDTKKKDLKFIWSPDTRHDTDTEKLSKFPTRYGAFVFLYIDGSKAQKLGFISFQAQFCYYYFFFLPFFEEYLNKKIRSQNL
jgi:hypothetical protein